MAASKPSTESSLNDIAEWSPEAVSKLFALVQPHRILYDPTDKQWMNKTLKGQLWNSVAKDLDPNLTSKKCRDRFYMYKRRFITETRKKLRQNEFDFDTNLFWLLDFVDEDSKENASSPRIPTPISSLDRVVASLLDRRNPPTASAVASTDPEPAPTAPTMATVATSTDPGPAKRPRPTFLIPRLPSVLGTHVPSTSVNAEKKDPDEECVLFGMQIAGDLRFLSSNHRIEARARITKIFCDLYLDQKRANEPQN